MLPELLAQIPAYQLLAFVSRDGAYDTKGCYSVIVARNAEAIIPVRKNGKPWQENTAGAQACNEALRATKRLGRTIWKKWRLPPP